MPELDKSKDIIHELPIQSARQKKEELLFEYDEIFEIKDNK